jgi:hypothetical protein
LRGAFLLAAFLLKRARYNAARDPAEEPGSSGQGRTEMANREQRSNREKKKPKADKNKKKGPPQPVSAFAAQAPGMGKPAQQPIKK